MDCLLTALFEVLIEALLELASAYWHEARTARRYERKFRSRADSFGSGGAPRQSATTGNASSQNRASGFMRTNARHAGGIGA